MAWVLWLVTFDPWDLAAIAPGLILTLAARWGIRRDEARSVADVGATGGEIARAILRAANLDSVAVVAVAGPMSDLYDAPTRTLRLSPEIHNGRTPLVAATSAQAAALATSPGLAHLSARLRMLASLGGLSAWMILASAILLRYTDLAVQGMTLFSAVVVASLLSVPIAIASHGKARTLLERSEAANPAILAAVAHRANASLWQTVAVPLTTRPVRIRSVRPS